MSQIIHILSSPEEALCLKSNIESSCLFEPIEAICDRSVSLCYLFKLYISKLKIANNVVCNIIWQLQGNTDVLDLYLKKYLKNHQYSKLHMLIEKIWRLCSEITFHYADLHQLSIHPVTKILHLIVKVKHLFIHIRTYCHNLQNMFS